MDNRTKLQTLGIKDLYYYENLPDGSRTTVCLLVKGDSSFARGVAICSPEDQYRKRRGRAMACGRALMALHHQESCLPIQPRLFRYRWNSGLSNGFSFKAHYLPWLNVKEDAIVGKAH